MGRILLVEDDPDVRQSLQLLLEDEGYEVEVAQHGREALDLLDHGVRPCMILSDLLMPVMDGVEFLGRLRDEPRYSAIPTLALSAASTVRPPPGTRLLRKPLSINDLLAEIDRACGRSAA